MSDRITREEMLMGMAHIASLRGTCSRGKVGVVIAKDGRVLSTGYNGAPAGMPHCTADNHPPITSTCSLSMHAEANAIAYAAREGVRVIGADLYTTFSPCVPCAMLIVNAGISRVVYLKEYRIPDGLDLLSRAGVLHEHFSGDMMGPDDL